MTAAGLANVLIGRERERAFNVKNDNFSLHESPEFYSKDKSESNGENEEVLSIFLTPLLSSQKGKLPSPSSSFEEAQNDTLHIHFNSTPGNILLFIILLVIIIWVITMNLFTYYSLRKVWNKRVGEVWDFYISNLIIIDTLVGLFVFPFMSIVVLVEFPFSKEICAIFVFIDYFLIISSAFGYSALMVIFYWTIKWSRSFLETPRKVHLYIICGCWVTVNIVWLPAYLSNLLLGEDEPGACGFNHHLNPFLTLYCGIFGLYIPLVICIVATILSRNLLKTIPRSKIPNFLPAAPILSNNSINHIPEYEVRRSSILLKKVLSNSFIFSVYELQENSRLRLPFLYVILALFIISRLPFYFYFVAGAFFENLSHDLTRSVYWIMHADAAIGPLVHLIFDPELRTEILKCFGLKASAKRFKRTRIMPIITQKSSKPIIDQGSEEKSNSKLNNFHQDIQNVRIISSESQQNHFLSNGNCKKPTVNNGFSFLPSSESGEKSKISGKEILLSDENTNSKSTKISILNQTLRNSLNFTQNINNHIVQDAFGNIDL